MRPDETHSRLDRIALILIAGYVLALLFAGWKIHFIETPNSAEMDGYADKAREIMAGQIPRDPYHPLFYPVLSALVGAVARNAFTGARIVSSLAAGLLALMTYLVGRRCFGRGVGFFALIALLVNCNVVIMGMEAATDMTFAALAMTMLFFCIRVSSGLRYRDMAFLAASFALALFTRYNALFLLPAVVIACGFSVAGVPIRRRALALLLFAAVAALALTPHFILTERVFGRPWYSESWRNLALKVHGDYDWSYFRNAHSEGVLSIILSSPAKFTVSSFRELVKFFYSTLTDLGGGALAGGLFAAAALTGFYAAWFEIDRRKIVVASLAVFFVGLNCMFFYSGPRLMLPVLPLGYLWAGAAMLSGPFAGSFRAGRLRIARSIPAIALFAAALLTSSVIHVDAYVKAQPVRELEAARLVEQRYGDRITVLGTFPFMQRYVGYRYVELSDATSSEIDHPAAYIASLGASVRAKGADFVIIGKFFLENRPLELLNALSPPDFLEPIVRESDVVVYRVRKELLQ
jgi:hypothetical protein